jgi:Domain of unknown function (DUF4399)
MIDLPPSKHTLRLVMGDANHYVFNPSVVSKPITVWVRSSNYRPRSRIRHKQQKQQQQQHDLFAIDDGVEGIAGDGKCDRSRERSLEPVAAAANNEL